MREFFVDPPEDKKIYYIDNNRYRAIMSAIADPRVDPSILPGSLLNLDGESYHIIDIGEHFIVVECNESGDKHKLVYSEYVSAGYVYAPYIPLLRTESVILDPKVNVKIDNT